MARVIKLTEHTEELSDAIRTFPEQVGALLTNNFRKIELAELVELIFDPAREKILLKTDGEIIDHEYY